MCSLGPFIVGGGNPKPNAPVAVGLDRVLHLALYALTVDRLVAAALAGEQHPHAVYGFARRIRIESSAISLVVGETVPVVRPVAGPDVREPVVVSFHEYVAAVIRIVAGAQTDVRRAVAACHVQRTPCLDSDVAVFRRGAGRGFHVDRRTAAGARQTAMGAFLDLKGGMRDQIALDDRDGDIVRVRAGGHFELVGNLDGAARLDLDLRKTVRVASVYLVRLAVAGDGDLAGVRVVRPAVAACIRAFHDPVAVYPQRDVREVFAVALPLGIERQVAGVSPDTHDGAAVRFVVFRSAAVLARVPAFEVVAVAVRRRAGGGGVAELGQQVLREARTVIEGDRVFDGGVGLGAGSAGRPDHRRRR